MGSLANGAIWWILILVMVIWMVLKIARSSSLMAVVTFFFWPAAVLHLISNWGDPDGDIKIPFLIALIASGMMTYQVFQAADEVALESTAEEIAELRQQDPIAAAVLERRQRDAVGVEAGVNEQAGDEVAESNSAAISAGSSSQVLLPDRPAMRMVPIAELNFRRNDVRIDPAYVNLGIPQHFRYISAEQLGALAKSRGIAVDSKVLGWIVHDRIDLTRPDFWFVEVGFESIGYLPAPLPPATIDATLAAAPGASQGSPVANGPATKPATIAAPEADPFAPHWDGASEIATWAEISPKASVEEVDLCATRLLRHGALVLCVRELDLPRRELGLRASRLVAARARVDSGWGHAMFSGGEPSQTFEEWLAKRQPLSITAEAADAEAQIPAEAQTH